MPRAQRREIDEQLERRARLAPGLHDAIELALCVVAAARHGQNGAIGRQRDQRRLLRAEGVAFAPEPLG